ncbi:hypothetical protein Ddye_021443 [Dipteronia dyeriana]|uniref:Uncharacterized protein n=1 Tax=Dipteronia dyeriana TaxID=168575 RepID=A0AAD9WXJ2_9ROSI|nr:hypothetical protein Ddye_021443 [Dipteronia dyeriana]
MGALRVIDYGLARTFQAFQSQLFLRKYVNALSKRVTSLSSLTSKMKKEVEETKYSMAEMNKVSKEVINKLSGLEEEVARVRDSLKSSGDKLSQTDKRLANALERLDNAADEAVIETIDDEDDKDMDEATTEFEKEGTESQA